MHDAGPSLRWAVGVQTPRIALALGPNEGLLARRAHAGEGPLGQAFRSERQHRADNLRDHVARLAHHDRVARANVLQPYLVLIVQSGHANGRAADEHGLEHGEWRGLPGTADRHHDVLEDRGALLRRELVGDRPPRCLAGHTELGPLVEVVDLDDGAVDLVRKVVSVLLPIHAVAEHVVERREDTDLRIDRKATIGQERERLGMGAERRTTLDGA